MLSPEHRTVIRICRRLGIPLGLGPSDGTYRWSWDGKKLDIHSRFSGFMGTRPASDSLHDIAHWLLCSAHRRRLPEFGLGGGVDGRSRPADRVVSAELAVREEGLASLLGMLMERRLGWDWRETFEEHNWQDEWPTGYKRQRRELEPWLKRRGFSLDEILEACR